LTDKQVASLPTKPIELVPAPGEGKCLMLTTVDGVVAVHECDATDVS
jgi:hypothetical protein